MTPVFRAAASGALLDKTAVVSQGGEWATSSSTGHSTVDTMSLSILERRRELGPLRIIGMSVIVTL